MRGRRRRCWGGRLSGSRAARGFRLLGSPLRSCGRCRLGRCGSRLRWCGRGERADDRGFAVRRGGGADEGSGLADPDRARSRFPMTWSPRRRRRRGRRGRQARVLLDRAGRRLPHGDGVAVGRRRVPRAGAGHGLDADGLPARGRGGADAVAADAGRRRRRQRDQRRARLAPLSSSSTSTSASTWSGCPRASGSASTR